MQKKKVLHDHPSWSWCLYWRLRLSLIVKNVLLHDGRLCMWMYLASADEQWQAMQIRACVIINTGNFWRSIVWLVASAKTNHISVIATCVASMSMQLVSAPYPHSASLSRQSSYQYGVDCFNETGTIGGTCMLAMPVIEVNVGLNAHKRSARNCNVFVHKWLS